VSDPQGKRPATLAKVLLAEMGRLGLSQSELAQRCGLSQHAIHTYCIGKREPSLASAMALERGLGRPAGWLARQLAAEE
jgi:transcriptional regulator with XRE-family HTH domain